VSFLVKPPTIPGRRLVAGAPEGHAARALADLARAWGEVLFVARDDAALASAVEALAFFAPDVERVEFPAWDCLPFDRVSPNPVLAGRRVDALARLAGERPTAPRAILTTASAVLQRVPARAAFEGASLALAPGARLSPDEVTAFLVRHGYGRTQTVMEPGEYAVRGGILDVFPPGAEHPLRLDFFGDTLDAVRAFDPETQRTVGKATDARLEPTSEVPLDPESIARFRTGYRALFGAPAANDALYEAVSAGRRHMGMEHWIALFHERLETLFDYVPGAGLALDHRLEEAVAARFDTIAEYFTARAGMRGKGAEDAAPYNPVPPERTYLARDEWERLLAARACAALSPFAPPDVAPSGTVEVADAGGRSGRDFADVRVQPGANVYEALKAHVARLRGEGRRVLVTASGEGSRERIATVMREHGIGPLRAVANWTEAIDGPADAVATAVVDLARGFVAPGLAVVTEQDILGERLTRRAKRRVRAENFIAEASELAQGDLVVHADHGIGRYEGLQAVEAGGAPHDCLRLLYDGGDRLYLPVENIELISRYGSEQTGVALDKLGGAAWQARKSRLKSRIREMAAELIRIAAARAVKSAPAMAAPEGLYDEFCARFPFAETEDQLRAIEAAVGDLAGGRPTDRLVCGDVGFGKTEVALRAAFVAALAGRQVAVVTPTTLLCRQHFRVFGERFAGFPVRIAELSRLAAPREAEGTLAALAQGKLDIVIGTHALLGPDVRFRDLGLLVVDEEQHFGVAHKERLKALSADVHVLTLSATPIPRTLQLALAGLKEMSLISTPPVDRLAVRTFVLPYDPVIVREAILRERFRGGQVFCVCPRIEDLGGMAARLKELVPDLKIATAHGRMAARELERSIGAFYDGAFDLLLTTNIIESGLDLPRVNTIIIHRADMFGLAQLYQLRGRVGRSKIRAYAYLTLPPGRTLSAAAEKRLQVMQTLDTLGAGFTLASHDLDIRGAGNLLGQEQSGHIREVGVELYQQMLEDAVAEARGGDQARAEGEWSPRIDLGMAVLIPEAYVPDLGVRMGLYRRLAHVASRDELESFAAELIDRFGPLPPETANLIEVVAVKIFCRAAGVEKIEAGPKGAVVAFRNNTFANPEGLVRHLTRNPGAVRVRPDQKLIFAGDWATPAERLKGVQAALGDLARIAAGG
jgi:transcription-repair coupling factor (superfamily II helicase)